MIKNVFIGLINKLFDFLFCAQTVGTQAHSLLFAETLFLLFQFAGFACFLLSVGLASVGFALLLFAGFLLGIGLAAIGLTLCLLASLALLVGLALVVGVVVVVRLVVVAVVLLLVATLALQLLLNRLVDSLRCLASAAPQSPCR